MKDAATHLSHQAPGTALLPFPSAVLGPLAILCLLQGHGSHSVRLLTGRRRCETPEQPAPLRGPPCTRPLHLVLPCRELLFQVLCLALRIQRATRRSILLPPQSCPTQRPVPHVYFKWARMLCLQGTLRTSQTPAPPLTSSFRGVRSVSVSQDLLLIVPLLFPANPSSILIAWVEGQFLKYITF